eukprot:scaffold16736_cov22-Tisochrysis_lutea.AAC.5
MQVLFIHLPPVPYALASLGGRRSGDATVGSVVPWDPHGPSALSTCVLNDIELYWQLEPTGQKWLLARGCIVGGCMVRVGGCLIGGCMVFGGCWLVAAYPSRVLFFAT